MSTNFDKISDLILANNHHFVAFNKPAGLPAQADKTNDLSLLEMGSAYCKTDLYPIHRIDRPTSGLIVYAKTSAAVAELNNQLREQENEKIYLAIVAEHPPRHADTLEHYLVRDGRHKKARVVKAAAKGAKKAVLHYNYLGGSDRYHLLQIKLDTGRFHQIRAQLGEIGLPVRGDVKYGARRRNPDRGIDLHAYQMTLRHPGTDEETTLTAPPPATPLWTAFAESMPSAGDWNSPAE